MKRFVTVASALVLAISLLLLPLATSGVVVVNRMLNFGGGTDAVDIGDVNALDGISQFTLEMWIRVSGTPEWGTFFTKTSSDHTHRIIFQFYDNLGNLGFAVANGVNSYWRTTNNPITIGDWFHLGAVFDGTQANNNDRYTIYINGVRADLSPYNAGVTAIPATTSSNTYPVVIGAEYSSGAYDVNGDMDEVRVWTDVRTQAEIIANMNSELTGTESNLLMYYDFNQGVPGGDNSGETTLIDRTGHGYTGALNNFALTGNTSNWLASAYTAPSVQASNIVFSNVARTQFDISWTRGSGNQVIVFAKEGSSGTASPADNTTYTANSVFRSGSQIGATGWYAVYNGAGNNVTVTGLSPSTTYQVHVSEFNGSIGNEVYNASTATNNPKSTTTTAAPTVSNVTSAKTDGAYTTGEVIDITVAFSEAVYVTGSPYLELETGATDRNATYNSGNGTATLTFRYTVQAGDTSSDLDYKATTSLKLDGGTIKDAAGNNVTLTLAAPGAAGSLGYNKALVIPSPVLVGVEVYPVNKLALLAPWLVLAVIVALAIGGSLLARRQRRA